MKHTLALLCFLSAFALSAQQDSSLAKKWMIGGNAEFYIERTDVSKENLYTLFINPQAGYFVTNTFVAGLRMPFGFTVNSYQVSLLPFVSYYFPTKGPIRPFVELNSGIEWDNTIDGTSYKVDYKQTSWISGARGGAAFFINSNISVDTFLYYTLRRKKWQDLNPDAIQSEGRNTVQKFGLGVGFQIYL